MTDKPIERKLSELAAKVPDEEWEKVPSNLMESDAEKARKSFRVLCEDAHFLMPDEVDGLEERLQKSILPSQLDAAMHFRVEELIATVRIWQRAWEELMGMTYEQYLRNEMDDDRTPTRHPN